MSDTSSRVGDLTKSAAEGLRVSGSLATFTSELRDYLRTRPEAEILVEDNAVTVLRLVPHGPDVTAIIDDQCHTLVIGGWHDDLQSLPLMLAYIKMAVEGDLRVRVDMLGAKPWRYALELRLSDGTWFEQSSNEFPRFLFWRPRKRSYYLQNDPHNSL